MLFYVMNNFISSKFCRIITELHTRQRLSTDQNNLNHLVVKCQSMTNEEKNVHLSLEKFYKHDKCSKCVWRFSWNTRHRGFQFCQIDPKFRLCWWQIYSAVAEIFCLKFILITYLSTLEESKKKESM